MPRYSRCGEALICLPHKLVMFVGQAWIAAGDEDAVRPDDEHDEYAWWPREIDEWPAEAGETLPRMARWPHVPWCARSFWRRSPKLWTPRSPLPSAAQGGLHTARFASLVYSQGSCWRSSEGWR